MAVLENLQSDPPANKFLTSKQPLRIKAFYGSRENAVKIWIAVSIHVLVAIARKRLGPEVRLYRILEESLQCRPFELQHTFNHHHCFSGYTHQGPDIGSIVIIKQAYFAEISQS
jgi:hypothetical protein